MMFNRYSWLSAALLFFFGFSFSAQAQINYYLRADVGASFAKVGDSSTIYLTNGLGYDTYSPNKKTTTAPVFGAHVGFIVPISNYLELSTGIAAEQALNYQATGKVFTTIGGLTVHTFDYKYKVNSLRFMAETALRVKCKKVVPFIEFGVGTAINEAYNYKEHAVGPFEAAPFESHYSPNLAYQIGGGIDYQITKNDSVGLSYRYVSLGTINFGARQQPDYPGKLIAGRLKANDLVLSLTHTF